MIGLPPEAATDQAVVERVVNAASTTRPAAHGPNVVFVIGPDMHLVTAAEGATSDDVAKIAAALKAANQ